MASGGVLFLGFDFGTTFSSVSFAIHYPGGLETPLVKTAIVHAAQKRRLSPRVPSTLTTDPKAPHWGPFIPPGTETLRLLKLSLPHEEDLPDHPDHSKSLDEVREALRMIRQVAGMKGVAAAAKYLRQLWKGCELDIAVNAAPLLLKDMAVRIVFTIPASWREDAISRMRDVVSESGILNVGHGPAAMEFLAESEAAALAILPGLAESKRCKVGELVVICDCGGGTVDVGSYEVTSLSPLTVRECVHGESQLCGAIYMGDAFSSLINQKLADLAKIRDDVNINRVRSISAMQALWEGVLKTGFQPPERMYREILPVFLHGDEDVPSGPPLEISSDEISAVFRSVTTSIIRLATKQVKALLEKKEKFPKLVVLTGGFSCNLFLQQEFSSCFGAMMHVTGLEGWLAVSNGATIAAVRGFYNVPMKTSQAAAAPASIEIPILIESRVARVSYGYRCGTGPGDHITWFIQKGDDITTGQVKQFDLPSSAFAPNIDQGCHYVPIYRIPDVTLTSSSTTQTAPAAYPFCRIKWKADANILALNPAMKVQAHLNEHTMRFQVVCNGHVMTEEFIVIETLYRL